MTASLDGFPALLAIAQACTTREDLVERLEGVTGDSPQLEHLRTLFLSAVRDRRLDGLTDIAAVRLFRLLGNFDLDLAASLLPDYKRLLDDGPLSNQIRYIRVEASVTKTRDFLAQGGGTRQVLSFDMTTCPTVQANTAGHVNWRALCAIDVAGLPLTVHLEHGHRRVTARRSAALARNEQTEAFYSKTTIHPARIAFPHYTVTCLPKVSVTVEPTAYYFETDGRAHFCEQNVDQYHHLAASGRTIAQQAAGKVASGYLVPRIGQRNYYHSLIDKMPFLDFYVASGCDLPIIINQPLNRFEEDFLAMRGWSHLRHRMLELQSFVVDRGFLLDRRTIKHRYYDGCRQFAASLPKAAEEAGERLYISRRKAPDRRMANEAELEERLQELGFSIIQAEDLSLMAQASTFARATCVVAPHGAGLTNLIHCPAATKVVEVFSSQYVNGVFALLAADCDLAYTPIVCEQQASGGNDGWSADIDRVIATVAGLVEDL
jgi:capsular polysaccharide biosynthesis protein